MDAFPVVQKVARTAMKLQGFKSRFVQTQHGQVHVYEAVGHGPLPTIVVQHGVAASGAPFARVMQELRRSARRVLAPELLGHGSSSIPDKPLRPEMLSEATRQVLNELLDEPAIVFGNSLGGGIALRYAMDEPEQVRALIVCSPAGARSSHESLEDLRSVFSLKSHAEAISFLNRLYHKTPWYAPLLSPTVRTLVNRPHIRRFLADVRPEDAFLPEELSKLTMPILLLWGQSDSLLPREHLAYFQAHLPAHARVEEPDDFGHSPQLEQPRMLARKIASFGREHNLKAKGLG